jgi:hypothetical protein
MDKNGERTQVSEYYDDINQFVTELYSINVRKLVDVRDKKLIQKLKKWYKTYWDNEKGMDLYESQYRRLKEMVEQNVK